MATCGNAGLIFCDPSMTDWSMQTHVHAWQIIELLFHLNWLCNSNVRYQWQQQISIQTISPPKLCMVINNVNQPDSYADSKYIMT